MARAAFAARVPILPVGVWGTQARWPLGDPKLSLPLRVPVAVVMGDPIQVPDADRSPESIREVTQQVMESIEAQVTRAQAITGFSGQPSA